LTLQETLLHNPAAALPNKDQKAIATWLLVCCATIFGMIILGGVTRLTGSGLSMVEWAPIMGVLPPLNQDEWQRAFQLYQQYPEYQLKNFHMSLHDFKSIFWFEYGHRLLGRSIGMIFLLPFLYFLFRGMIEKALTPKLITMFVLGGLQGLMGWYMVKSGLVNDPHVSQYRLTAHLGLAIIIYSYMLWVALGLLYPKISSSDDDHPLARTALIISTMIFITAMSGGFVAGTHAGFAFNTFPLMDGRLIPAGLFELSPLWRNFFENIVTVQFDHRVLATLLFLIIPAFWFRAGKLASENKLSPMARTGSHLLLGALALQITLGISTLLLVVPVPLAAAHQAGAIILLTSAIFVSQQLHR
jgi:heme a synthase